MDPIPGHELALELARQREWLQGLARALVGADDADDLAQATFVVALERRPKQTQNLRAWLAGIARNLARDRWRASVRRAHLERDSAKAEPLSSAAEVVEQVDAEQRIARAVLALREPLRDVLLLRYHEGLTSPQIAARLGVPEGTVRTRVQTGLAELRERLQREFGGENALGLVLLELARGPAVAAGAGVGMLAAWKLWTVAVCAALGLVVAGSAWFGDGSGSTERATADGERAVLDGNAAARGEARNDTAEHVARDARAPAAAGVGVPRAVLRVLEPSGAPHARQAVWLLGRTSFARARMETLDDEGRAAFAPEDGTRTLVIERTGAMPARVEVELAPVERVIALDAGGVVSGTVLVRGAPPPAPLALELWPRGAFDPALPRSASEPPVAARVTTAADGSFRIGGVANARHELVLPCGFALAGKRALADVRAPPILALEGPVAGLLIDLEPHKRLEGRVVAGAETRPVALAELEVRVERAHGATDDFGAVAGDDGRFQLHVEEDARAVRVRWGRPGRVGQDGELRRDWDAQVEHLDLGDLPLGPLRDVTFVVRDTDGAPIAGALVHGVGRTNPRGEVRERALGAAAVQPLVRAWGFRAARARVPAEAVGRVDVVLEKTTLLTLAAREPDGQPARELLVRLRSTGAAPADPSVMLGAKLLAAEGEARFRAARMLAHGYEVELVTGADGRVHFDGFAPGERLRIAALDDAGNEIRAEEVTCSASTERRELVFTLPERLRGFAGRVVDARGNPIANAEVELAPTEAERGLGQDLHGRRATAKTDLSGRFRLARIQDAPLRLSVTASGFVPFARKPYAPPAAELEFVLEPGRDVTVRVRDASGAPVSTGVLELVVEDTSVAGSAQLTGPGEWRVQGVGGAARSVRLALAGRSFDVALGGGADEFELRVPVAGSCAVEWDVVIGDPNDPYRVVLTPVDGGGAPLEDLLSVQARGESLFDWVLPGVYSARLVQDRSSGNLLLAGPVRVAVEAGATARVRLAR